MARELIGLVTGLAALFVAILSFGSYAGITGYATLGSSGGSLIIALITLVIALVTLGKYFDIIK